MNNKRNGITSTVNKLASGKWLLDAAQHESLCKTVQAFLDNPFDFTPKAFSPPTTNDGAISDTSKLTAVVEINGVLGKNVSEFEQALLGVIDVDDIEAAIDEAASDDEVKQIVLHFRSPGGDETGIPELARKIADIDANVKPVYAFTDDSPGMCSAAYWLGSQCRAIGMTPSGKVGSVGVYMLVLNEKKALDDAGIKVEPFSAGKYKLMGHSFKD